MGKCKRMMDLSIDRYIDRQIANVLEAHIETHGKLILRTLSYLTVNSQDDSELFIRSPDELTKQW